jgi:hypothetical protein
MFELFLMMHLLVFQNQSIKMVPKNPSAQIRRVRSYRDVNRQLAGVSTDNALAPLALRRRFSAVLPFTDIYKHIMTPFYAKVKLLR